MDPDTEEPTRLYLECLKILEALIRSHNMSKTSKIERRFSWVSVIESIRIMIQEPR